MDPILSGRQKVDAIVTGVLILFSSQALAYKVFTHEWLTLRAYNQSRLAKDPSYFSDLGVNGDVRLPISTSDLLKARDAVIVGSRLEDESGRPANHFFDPQNGGRPLTIVTKLGAASPSWVLEDDRDHAAQFFSIHHMNDYFLQGLTGRTDGLRARALGVTFESMGRAVHHLQDMAQPQHVRNDQHLTGVATSAYEAHTADVTEKRALPDHLYGANGNVDLWQFNTGRRFWSNSGKGIAEFTSNNFVSVGTNFRKIPGLIEFGRHASYPLPDGSPCPNKPRFEVVHTSQLPGVVVEGLVSFAKTPVLDLYAMGNSCNERSSSLSIFDGELVLAGSTSQMTLNRFNYDEAHKFLMPRAIAYSAGFIDYFFRGRLKAEDFSVSGDRARITLRNVSAADFGLADSLEQGRLAEFEIWYEAADGNRKRASALNANLNGVRVDANQTHIVEFQVPADLDSSKQRPYIAVFKGKIGNEEGVAGVTFGDSGAVVVTPGFQTANGVSGRRLLSYSNGQWTVSPTTGALAGNVDWRGHNGDVVTWDGPQSRHFLSAAQRNGISPNVYMGGVIAAVAPGNVIGAAARRTANGLELIAATIEEGSVVVYARRHNASSSSNSLFHPTSNPYGWRALGSVQVGIPDSPLFFNASANQAQMMVDGYKARIKIGVGEGSVSSERINARGHGHYLYTGSFGGANNWDSLQQWIGGFIEIENKQSLVLIEPTIVCADYVGDRELLCKVSADPARYDRHSERTTYQRNGVGHRTASGSFTRSDRRVLEVGKVRLELSGKKTHGTFSESESFHTRYVMNSETVIDDDARTATISYLDIRNDIVAYAAETDKTHRVITRSPAPNPGGVNVDTVTSQSRSSEVFVMTGSQERRVGAFDSTPATTNENGHYDIRGTESAVFGLGSYSVGGPQTYELTSPFDDSSFTFRQFINPRALGVPMQGFGVTANGTLVASMEIWLQQAGGNEQKIGLWNVLPGSDFESVIPSANGSGGGLFPIGVVR